MHCVWFEKASAGPIGTLISDAPQQGVRKLEPIRISIHDPDLSQTHCKALGIAGRKLKGLRPAWASGNWPKIISRRLTAGVGVGEQPKPLDKCTVRIERLEELGYELRRPQADFLRDGIYELRVGLQYLNYRMLYFFHGRIAAVVSHGLVKESAVPPKEIEKAIVRKRKLHQDGHRDPLLKKRLGVIPKSRDVQNRCEVPYCFKSCKWDWDRCHT